MDKLLFVPLAGIETNNGVELQVLTSTIMWSVGEYKIIMIRYFLNLLLYVIAVLIVFLLAGLITLITKSYPLGIVFMLLLGLPIRFVFIKVQEWINEKMTITEKRWEERLDRENRERVMIYESDADSGITFEKEYKTYEIDSKRDSNLLPISDASIICMEVAYSFKRSLSDLELEQSYEENFERFKINDPDLEFKTCMKRLKKRIHQAYERSNYWDLIKNNLPRTPLINLLNEVCKNHDANNYSTEQVIEEEGFLIRDVNLEEHVFQAHYKKGTLIQELALIPGSNGNYQQSTTHRIMMYGSYFCKNASLFTSLSNTHILKNGYYFVADNFSDQNKTMILLIHIPDPKTKNDSDLLKYEIDFNPDTIVDAKNIFKASFDLPISQVFSTDTWLEIVAPVIGEPV